MKIGRYVRACVRAPPRPREVSRPRQTGPSTDWVRVSADRMMAAPCVAFTPVPSGSPCSCPGVASLARSVEVMTCNEDSRITSTTAETGRDLTLAALRVTSNDHGLPTLRVTPGDLAYLAEGADHMVVRLLGLVNTNV